MFLNITNPVYLIKRKGTVDDPYISITESIGVNNNKIALKEIPDKLIGVTVKDGASSPYVEVVDKNNIANNQFYIDYKEGVLYFNPSANDIVLTFTYKGTGVMQYPASRIYIDNDGKTPVQTLQDLVNNNGISSESSQYAQQQGDYAKTQGDYAKSQGDRVNGIISGAGAIPNSDKGIPNGVASLDSTGKVPSAQLNIPLPPSASTAVAGIVQLSTSTSSTSTSLASTASAVKIAYDLANGKYTKPPSGIPLSDLDTSVQTSLGKADNAVPSIQKGVANGVATLGADGKIPSSQLGTVQADGATIRSDSTKALVVEVRTSDPTIPVIGQIWFRSDL